MRELQASPQVILITGIVVLGCFVLLSGSLSNLQLSSGTDTGLMSLLEGTFNRPGYTPWNSLNESTERLPGWLLVLFWACVAVCVLYAVISPAYRKALLVTAVTAVLLVYIARSCVPKEGQDMETITSPSPIGDMGTAQPPPEPPERSIPRWLTIVIGTGAASGLGVGGYKLWQLWLAGALISRRQLLKPAAEAVQQLDAGQDIADTVARCYLSMIQVLEQHQRVRRADAMTPREFESHLRKAGLHSRHVHQLSQMFERVRFGSKPTGERERLLARDCLAQIVATWGEPA